MVTARFVRLTFTLTAFLAASAVGAAPRRPAVKARAAALKARAAAAPKAPPAAPRDVTKPPPIMPISQVRAGMTGYGLSVFKGTKIERFGFKVLGVLPRMYMGQPLILVRLSGGPMTERGAFLIQGMSGSPCFVNGRLIGAFSMGERLAKEPIGFLTPIEPMLEALDPKLPNRPPGVSEAEFGVSAADTVVAGRMAADWLSRVGLSDDPASLFEAPATGGMGPQRLMTPVMVSGLSGRAFRMLETGLRRFGMAATPSPGSMRGSKIPGSPPPLQPGSAVGIQLVSGDVDMAAFGTVTYRRGNQILAFGHPFFQLGPTNFPLTTAWIHDVFPGVSSSHWIASTLKPIGTMLQDRPYSIACRLGATPPMIPLTCTVDDRSTGRKRTFRAQVVNHPLLSPMLVPIAINQAIYQVHPVPGDATATVRTEIKTESFGAIVRENQVFDATAIDMAALEDVAQAMDVLSRNRFQRVPVKGLNVHVTIEEKRRTAAVERIFVRQEKFEPGEKIEVGVILRPYRGEPFTAKAEITVPEYAGNGRAVLMVSGGPSRVAVPGIVVAGAAGQTPGIPGGTVGSGPNANSVTQLVQQYLAKEKNNQLVTRIVFATPAVNVAGTTLSQLPSTLAAIMRSARASGLRTDRDEVKSIQDMDWLVSGAQSLVITIERKDQSEKRSVESGTAKPSGSTSVTDVTSPYSPSATTLSLEDEIGDAESAGRSEGEPLTRFSDEDDVADAKAAAKPAEEPKPAEERKSRSRRGRRGAKPTAVESKIVEPAKTDDTDADTKLVGRAATRWTQASQADFERGTMEAVGVSAVGDIRLAPRLKVLHETTEQYIWSMAAGNGVTYAGTGNSGLVYKIPPSGEPSVLFKTGELEVHALARDRQGNVYAGTSPNGKVFRITPEGQGKLLFAMNPDDEPLRVPAPPARFVLALAVADDGTVYAATGPQGRIYRITPDGQSSLFYQAPDQYVMSLLAVGDRLYAGTADSGLVYEIDRAGQARGLHDSDEKAITALARDREGRLYAATAPKGIIYRITPSGAVTTVWDKSKGAVYALAATGNGELYAACSNVIYRIGEGDKVTVLSDSKRAQFVALTVDDTGRLFAGSANIGTLYALETAATGSFESAVHDAKTLSQWGQIRWVASVPDGASLQFETRSGSTPSPDTTWSPWAVVIESTSGTQVASPPARFIQYRVKMTGSGASPVLRQVVISYLTRNQAPTVALTTPGTGEFWRGAKEIKWTGRDPDKDTLTYEIYFSPDNGKSWKRIGERVVAPPKPEPKPADEAAASSGPGSAPAVPVVAGNPALEQFRTDLATATDLSPEDRRQALQQADDLIKKLAAEEAQPKAPAASSAAPSAEEEKSDGGVTRESSLRWDTTKIPDGTYTIKVVATDRASNPAEPLSDEVISDPVVVANRPPHLVCFTHAKKVGNDRKALVAGIAEARVPIQGAQYRVDGGEWTALVPTDGIWDGRFEPWSLTTATLSRGKHQIELKLVDVAGNVATQSVPIEVQ